MNILYSIETRCQRFIPAKLFQFRWWDLFMMPAVSPLVSQSGESPTDDCQFAIADRQHFTLLADQTSAETVEQRWQSGAVSVIATLDDRLVGVVWFQHHRYADLETELRFELNPRDAWLYGAWVARAHRRCGIYRRLVQFGLTWLSSQSTISKVWFAIDKSNFISRRAHERLGASRIGSAWVCRILNFRQAKCQINGMSESRTRQNWTFAIRLPD